MVDWWFGLLSYACVFTHLSTWKYLRQIAWKCTIWKWRITKIFWGKGTAPSPDLTLIRALTLVPSMGNCHGCPQILENAPGWWSRRPKTPSDWTTPWHHSTAPAQHIWFSIGAMLSPSMLIDRTPPRLDHADVDVVCVVGELLDNGQTTWPRRSKSSTILDASRLPIQDRPKKPDCF